MANKRTMRKRKKLHLWKQEPWQYFALVPLGKTYYFAGTVWGWTRKEAKVKFNRRFPNTEVKLVGPELLVAYMRTGKLCSANLNNPKIIRHPAVIRELKERSKEND